MSVQLGVDISVLHFSVYSNTYFFLHTHVQTQPVTFTVTATVTPSELTFDRDSIDFGSCTTHESVVATLHLTNTSLLPQSFGFVGLPAFVDVQPGDGFGEILPEETLAVDVIFSARKPREYSFDLVIKTAIDKYVCPRNVSLPV